jgi:hypothetical protein
MSKGACAITKCPVLIGSPGPHKRSPPRESVASTAPFFLTHFEIDTPAKSAAKLVRTKGLNLRKGACLEALFPHSDQDSGVINQSGEQRDHS